MLVKNYGIMLRIQYKQKISHWLTSLLEPGESVYQLSGNDLALRLNTESHQERITALDNHLKQFRSFGMEYRYNLRLALVIAMSAHRLIIYTCCSGS